MDDRWVDDIDARIHEESLLGLLCNLADRNIVGRDDSIRKIKMCLAYHHRRIGAIVVVKFEQCITRHLGE